MPIEKRFRIDKIMCGERLSRQGVAISMAGHGEFRFKARCCYHGGQWRISL
jgi:hypothetical protein